MDYAFQDINDIPGTLPAGRTKLWGTGQAVLVAKKVIDTPFIVINADAYYGKEGFKAVHEYLVNGGKSCMAGFVLKNTLSDNGGVTRGICKMDENGNLTEVVETKNIVKTANGAETDGVAVDVNSLVSMNMWGLTPDFLTTLEEELDNSSGGRRLCILFMIWSLLYSGLELLKSVHSGNEIHWIGLIYRFIIGKSATPFYYIVVLMQLTMMTPYIVVHLAQMTLNNHKKLLRYIGFV